MAIDISDAFIAQYEAEVHQAYQQKGSKLRNMVRLRTGVVGSTCIFQTSSTGVAGLKTRHGNVPIMNVTHAPKTATLTDHYAADYVDKLDELKTNIDERMVIANAGAWALGRKVDELIITVLDSGSGTQDTASTLGLTRDRILAGFEKLNSNDVPDDGERYGLVGAHQWNELLTIDEFANSDFIGVESMPWLRGAQAKNWLGINWIMHSNLPLSSGTRKVFLFHKSAVGLAEGLGITAHMDWVPEKASVLINHMMSAGAVAIDGNGIYEIECDDDQAYA